MQLRVEMKVASGHFKKRRHVSVIRNCATGIAAKSWLQAMRSSAKNIIEIKIIYIYIYNIIYFIS